MQYYVYLLFIINCEIILNFERFLACRIRDEALENNIWREASNLATKYNALNFGQGWSIFILNFPIKKKSFLGFPNFDPIEHVPKSLSSAPLQSNWNNQENLKSISWFFFINSAELRWRGNFYTPLAKIVRLSFWTLWYGFFSTNMLLIYKLNVCVFVQVKIEALFALKTWLPTVPPSNKQWNRIVQGSNLKKNKYIIGKYVDFYEFRGFPN